MALLIALLIMLIIAALAVMVFHIIIWLCHWGESINKYTLYIKYSDFKKSYDINPEFWDLYCDKVYFEQKIKNGERYYGSITKFQFYPIGYYRYKFWKNRSENKKRKAEQKKSYQEVMSIIKSDTQYGQLSNKPPSIKIEVEKKCRDTVLKAVIKRLKEEFGMDVKIIDGTDKETKDETSI